VLEDEGAVRLDARPDELCAPHGTAGTERVEVADVRLVLESEVELDGKHGCRYRVGSASLEPLELDDAAADEPRPAARQRVDEGAADAERSPLDDLDRTVEMLVANEHVAVDLVARAAADRVVRMVAEEIAPREPHVLVREAGPLAERAKRGSRLDREQPALRALVRLLEVHAGRVDPAEDVLESTADELALVRRQIVRRRMEVREAPDRERRLQAALELGAELRQERLDRQVVRAVREENRLAVVQERSEGLDDRLHTLFRLVRRRQAGEVVVVRKELARDHLGAGGAPAECDAGIVDLVAHAAREEERAEAESGEHLRQLRGMPEAVRLVAGARRLDAETAADAAAEKEVADERLAADEDLVREDVPRARLEPSGGEERAQAPRILRADVHVVLEHDRLAVERERAERRVGLERVEHGVDDGAESQPEHLERHVPLAVPVRVGNDEEADSSS